MRYLDAQAVADIATGASLLGAGGGGDPFIGKLMAMSAVKKYGKVKLLSTDEIKDNDIFTPVAAIGAPSISTEKIPKGDEFEKAFVALEHYTHQKFTGTFPAEAGGGNSLMPIVMAAQKGVPVIDCDMMGRAFPGLEMSTLAINGVSSAPTSVTDEKGNSGIINPITPSWDERIVRDICTEMGGSCAGSLYIATGKQLKDYGVHNVVTLSQKLGQIVRNVPYTKKNPLKEILDLTHGYHLFDGKVTDISHKVKHGFNYGKISVEGINKYKGHQLHIDFQNENLIAVRDGKVVTSVPDLICFVDYDTLMPSDSEDIKYGKRLTVLGLPCSSKWRNKRGIATVGPRHFGYNFDYKPIEQLMKESK